MGTALLERESELAKIAESLLAARAGQGAVAVVEGAAGIGKSSLLAAAAELAGDAGMRVLQARGAALEQAYGFGTVRALFDPVRAGCDADEWASLTADAAGLALRALDPGAADTAPGDDPTHSTLHGLFWLTANLAAQRPLVICVDDAQWADPPSLRWLAHLARRIDGLALLVLVAVRSGEPGSDPALLDDLQAGPHDPVLRPRPLGAHASAALVRSRLGEAATPELSAACHNATGGNPFLLHALVGSLDAEGVPREPASIEQFGPEAVARAVARQLERLPAGAREVARAVTVLGAGAPLRHVAALAGVEPARAAHLTDALRSARLLAPTARLEFAHPILTAAVAAGLGPGERALWHERAWRLLYAEDADPERQALQLLQAEPAADPDAVRTLRAAARAAAARGAPESATTYLRRALAEPPDAATRPEVLLECGLALAAHRHADAPDLLREAIGLTSDPSARTAAGVRAARMLGCAALYEDVVYISRVALTNAEGAPADSVARLEAELIGIGMTRVGTLHDARARIARTRRDPPRVELWRINAALLDTFAGHPAREALELLRPLLSGSALADEQESLVATVVLGLALTWNDELETATAFADALLAATRPRGWASAVANGSWLRAMAHLRAGRIAEAAADARAAHDFKVAVSPPDSLIWAVAPLADALCERDELDAAEDALNTVGIDALPPGLLTLPQVLEARSRLRLAQQRPREALADARAAGRSWELLEIIGPGTAAWRVCAVEALVVLEEWAEARELAAEQLALAERHGAAGPLGGALRAVALAAPRAEALAPLERAAGIFAGGPGRLEHIRVLCDLGAALRRHGRAGAARVPLREALHMADRDGAVRLATRARSELRNTGARPRRAALTGREALTPAERRVAALAAEGQTNRQIAQQLFVTLRTVETHLTHSFAKLDITSRDDLGDALQAVERTTVAAG